MAKIINKIPLIVGVLVFIGLCVDYKIESVIQPRIERKNIIEKQSIGGIIQFNLAQKTELKDLILKQELGQISYIQAQKLIQYMNLQNVGTYKVKNDFIQQMIINLKITANK